MSVFPTLPADYESWIFARGTALARRDLAPALREVLKLGSLYGWAAVQPGRESFTGRGAAYGVSLGGLPVVVRHARRGGALAGLLKDRYLGAPRFLAEITIGARLAGAGIQTPPVVAAACYPAGFGHRADVATARIPGRDLAAIFFGDAPPVDRARGDILRAVGSAVRRLHDADFIHPDLQLRNILVVEDAVPGPPRPSPTIFLLDVDTCRTVRHEDATSRKWNLNRFHRSWDKHNRLLGARLTEADRAAFLAGYRDRA